MNEIPAPTYGPIRDAVELTVTLFGDHDAIDLAISEELGRRGCRTHTISVEAGWLASATNAIVRLDTAAGASALEGLTAASDPGVHIVAVGEGPGDAPPSGGLRDLCEQCSTSHDVALIWHGPITEAPIQSDSVDPPVRHLALTVVDEVSEQTQVPASPSFSIRSVAI